MVRPETQLYRFDEFRVDTIKRVLLRDNTPVQLPSRAFDVLLVLVDHNQYVIDKDELMRLVWGERVVEENNLTRHISTLRKVLDESPSDHRYIVTVPGRGYSFVAHVERVATAEGESATVRRNGGAASLEIESADPEQRRAPATITRLDPYIQSEATLRSEQTPTRRKNTLLAIALVVILGGAGLTALRLFNFRSRPAAVNSYRDWEIVKLTRAGGSVAPAISRDGKYVAYVNEELGRNSILIHQLATSTQQQITPLEKFSYRNLVFSPDGSELYFVRFEGPIPLGTLYRIAVLGGAPKKLRDDLCSIVMLSADGKHLAFQRRNNAGKIELIVANPDGGDERILISRSLDSPAWSPDGDVIVFSVGNADSGGEQMGIHEIRLSDGAQREITSQKWQHVGDKSWLPDGSGLIVSARSRKTSLKQLWFVAYPSGETRPLSNDLDSFNHVSLTTDARMMAAEQINLVSDIWSAPLADVASGKKIGVWGNDGLCLVPDGRVLYTGLVSQWTNELWISNADGSGRRQLTFDSNNDISPAVTPDGRYAVFASNRSGNFEIWRMNLDGSNLLQLTQSDGANPPSISTDGRWVIYRSSGTLFKVPIEGGEPLRICGKAVGVSTVSPDGKLIAYFAQGKDAWEIAVSSFEDGSSVKRFETGSQPLNNTSLKWTVDGKGLLYSQSSIGVANIWMQPLDGSAPKQVTDFKTDGIFRFDISPDGRNLICARGGFKHDIVLIKSLR